jgi:hypothetical protein
LTILTPHCGVSEESLRLGQEGVQLAHLTRPVFQVAGLFLYPLLKVVVVGLEPGDLAGVDVALISLGVG